MFSEASVSVILFTGGWGQGISSPRFFPGEGYPTPIRVEATGRYASYYNAFFCLRIC